MTQQQNFFTHGQRGPEGDQAQVFGRRQAVRALPAPDPQNYGAPPGDGTYTAPAYSPPGQQPGTMDGLPEYPASYIPRKFFYNSQPYIDPGPKYSIQQVLEAMADHFPELRGGTWSTEKRPEDGGENITFHKVSGEKGVSVAAVGADDLNKVLRFGTFGLMLICQVMLAVIGAILLMVSIKPKAK